MAVIQMNEKLTTSPVRRKRSKEKVYRLPSGFEAIITDYFNPQARLSNFRFPQRIFQSEHFQSATPSLLYFYQVVTAQHNSSGCQPVPI